MYKGLCLLVFIINNFIGAAQTNDSLLTDYSHLEDSAKAAAILEEVWEKRSNDPLTAIKLAKQALMLAENIEDKSLEAKALNFLGVVHTNIGANEIAFDYHLSALKKSKEAGNKIQLAYSYNNIGGIYRIKNDFVTASENISAAIKIFEEENRKTGLAYCFINMGRSYKDQGNFEKGLQYFKNALNLANESNNEDLRSIILLETADILFHKQKYSRAEKTYLELEKHYKNINYLKGLAEVWNKLSELYYKENKFKDALRFSDKATELNKQILNADGEINNLNNTALIHLALNQPAIGYRFLKESLTKSIQLKEPDLLIGAYKTHYEFYKKEGNLKQALVYFEKYHELQDSVYTNEEMIKFGELESLFKIEKTEKENQILLSDLEHQLNQRKYLIIIIVLFVLIAAAVTIRFYEKKKLSDKLRETNIVKDKFFRIIAHDLREPFNAIFSAVDLLKNNYDDLNERERKETLEAIGRLIKTDFDLLENLLMWSKNQSSFIEFSPVNLNLKEAIEKNINLVQNNIARKSINIKIDCPAELKINADEQMLNSILRNIIFNAVKFSHTGGEINIFSDQIGNNIKIEIADNGTGMSGETLANIFSLEKKSAFKGTAGESGSGIGLILTKEFIEKHKGTINVKSEEGKGSTFIITFPVS